MLLLRRFIMQGTEFDNFYVAPMCSQSRAALLTGRDFARTGTMLINGGEPAAVQPAMCSGTWSDMQHAWNACGSSSSHTNTLSIHSHVAAAVFDGLHGSSSSSVALVPAAFGRWLYLEWPMVRRAYCMSAGAHS